MGLDMYLNANRYLSPFDKTEKAISQRVSEIIGITPESDDLNALGRVSQVTIGVGYWRKANAIHSWFVANVQDGQDECQRSGVSREQLAELRDECNKVLADPKAAAGTLPTKGGFFFGSTDYDEYYLEDLRSTVEIIDKALKLPTDWEFEYHASW